MKSYNLWLVEEKEADFALKVLAELYGKDMLTKIKKLGTLETDIEQFPNVTYPDAGKAEAEKKEEGEKELTEEDAEKNLINTVTKVMRELGFPANLAGYKYLREGIIMGVKDVTILDSMTKAFYPAVAKKNGTTPSRVERAMRHAIEVAWQRGNRETLKEIFGYTISEDKVRPTTSEFVSLVVDKIRLSI